MKVKISLLSIVVLLSSNIYAKKIVLTPTIGKQLSTPSKEFQDDEVLLGIGLRGHLNKNYALDMRFSTSNSNLMGDGGKSDLERGSLNLYYDVFPDAKVSPYLFAGAGYEKLHRVYKNAKSQAFYQAGTGLRIDLTKSIELSTEAKYLKKTKSKTKEFIATMGIGAVFGNECDIRKDFKEKKIPQNTYKNIAMNKKLIPKPAIKAKDDKQDFFNDEVGYASKKEQKSFYKSKKLSTTTYKTPISNYIQIGSFHDKRNVKKMANSLKSRGYKIKLLKKSNLTTILVGPYKKSSITKIFTKIKRVHKDAFYKKL